MVFCFVYFYTAGMCDMHYLELNWTYQNKQDMIPNTDYGLALDLNSFSKCASKKVFAMCEHAKSLQSCLTLPSLWTIVSPGSSVHGILQAGILGVGCHSLLQGLSDPGMEPGSPVLQMDSVPSEPPGKPNFYHKHSLIRDTRLQFCYIGPELGRYH